MKISFIRYVFAMMAAMVSGVDSYAAPTNEYTIEFLIRTDAVSRNKVLLIAGSDVDGIFLNNEGYLLDSFSSNGVAISSHKAINDGNWHHVASVVNSTKKYLFVDNVLSGMVDIQEPKGNIDWGKIRTNGTAYNDEFQQGVDYFSGVIDRFTLTFEALYSENSLPTYKELVTEGLGGAEALRYVAGALPSSTPCQGMIDYWGNCFNNRYGKGYLDLNLAPPLSDPSDIIVKTGNNSAVIYFSNLKTGDKPVLYTATSTDKLITYSSENSPITINGLVYGKAYRFNLFAAYSNDLSIRGVDSPAFSVLPGQATYPLPAAPTWVKATAGIESATITFAAAGGPEVYKYTVTASPGNKTVTGTKSPIVFAGLNKSTAYTFKVKASNNSGTGDNSVDSNAITPLSPPQTPPGVPNNVSAKNLGASASVYFDPPISNNTLLPVVEYIVTAFPGESKTTGATSPITINGLEADKTYRFNVKARNSIGNGPSSELSNPIVTPNNTTTNSTTTSTATSSNTTLVSTTTTTQITSRSNIFLMAGQNYDLSSSNVNIYGNSQNEIVNLSGNIKGITADVNVESVTLPGGLTEYSLKSEGANILIYKNSDLVVTVAIQGDSNGTQLTFFNGGQGTFTNGSYNGSGTYNATISSGIIYVGGFPLNSNTPITLNPSALSIAGSATTTTTSLATTTTNVVTTTTTANSSNVSLAKGWNLIGAGGNESFKVSTLFGDKNAFVTVWKWIADKGQWAFYAPSMTATALSDYALAKGYQVLDTIQGSDGFWVNASSATSVSLPFGTAYTAVDHRASLSTGWNLISSGDNLTPVRFNNYLTIYSGSMPPSIGSETTTTVYQDNLTSLWAWDATNSKWYFYAPSLDRSQVLGDYIIGKGYLNFTTENKKLGSGTGFWVNKP